MRLRHHGTTRSINKRATTGHTLTGIRQPEECARQGLLCLPSLYFVLILLHVLCCNATATGDRARRRRVKRAGLCSAEFSFIIFRRVCIVRLYFRSEGSSA
ncbi:hypothetical protein Zmor_025125 [Zophobas morio]|uniref:Uncharacterized protein n=1 Tax=Zophobas morio TaxID=2755281 RepID=A0AA38HW49_9CUCU|nr:hypothetical protein Zmor_025125 [Zophobas morio]